MDNIQQPIDQQSLYQAPYHSVVFKNFLAGFSRGLGGIFAQLIFFFIMYLVFLRFIMPQLAPYTEMLQRTITNLEKMQQVQSQLVQPSNNSESSGESIDINQLLQQFQSGQTTR